MTGIAAAALVWSCSAGTEPSGVPRRVVIERGGDQVTPAGRALGTPLVVRVLDDYDRPVPNADVSVTIGAETGSSIATLGTTGTDGRVTMTPNAAPRAGDQEIKATLGDLAPALATLHAVAGTPETVAPYVGDAQGDTVGRLLAAPLVAVVRDTFGNVVANAPVTWQLHAGDGALSEAGSTTAGDGLVQARFTLGATPGTDSIEVRITTAHGAARSFFTVLAMAPAVASMEVQGGGPQSAAAGDAFPSSPVFRLLDAAGRPVPRVTVTLSTSAGGFIDPARAASDSSGIVRVTRWRASTRAGTDTLVVTGGGGKCVVLGTVLAGAPARLFIRTGIRDTLESGRTIGPRVVLVVADSAGNPVADTAVAPRTVTASVASGAGRLARQLTATSMGDSIVFDSLVVTGGGPHVIRFATPGLIAAATRPIYFTVHPVGFALTTHVTVIDSGATLTPALSVTDSIGVVAGAQVTWRSSDSVAAPVDTAGQVIAARRGQAMITARSVYEAGRRDSALVIVAGPGGPVLSTDLERFSFPRDTTITVAISVDSRSAGALGSATGALSWAPSMFSYVSSATAPGAPMLAVNDADAANGVLRFAFADADGRSGRTSLLYVTLHATGSGTGPVALSAAQVSNADASFTLLTARSAAVSTPVVIP